MQLGFLGGRSCCVFSSALLDRTWERWSGEVAWWGSILSYVATANRFCYEEALVSALEIRNVVASFFVIRSLYSRNCQKM